MRLFQSHCAISTHMPLFGQILAALYQEDIVEEDDICGWHILPSTSGGDGREGVERELRGIISGNAGRLGRI